MSNRRWYRLTILRAVVYVAVAGCLLGLVAANRYQLDLIAVILLPLLMLVVPAHFAIEANRREASHQDQARPEDRPNLALQRTRPAAMVPGIIKRILGGLVR